MIQEEQKKEQTFFSPDQLITLLKQLCLFQNMSSFPFSKLISTGAKLTDILFSLFCEEEIIKDVLMACRPQTIEDLIIYLTEANRTHNRICNAHFLHNIETRFADVTYLCHLLKEIQKLCSQHLFKHEKVKKYCNELMKQEGLKNFVDKVIRDLGQERERLVEAAVDKLDQMREAIKKYKNDEERKDVKGEEADYVYFKKAKVGQNLLSDAQWQNSFEWIGGAYKHNTNMDLRIGTNDLDADIKDDHLEICEEDSDDIVNELFIKPAVEGLKDRKRKILKELIALSQQPNKHVKEGFNQFNAVKHWILYFGLRASVCATEVIYGVAAIFSGIEKEQKPRNTEIISIYQNFQVWVKQIAKLRPDITTQRSVYKNFEKSQKSASFAGIKCTINENLVERIILKNSKLSRAAKKESVPYYFQDHLLRTWQADQRRLGAWRRISPLDHQEMSELRTIIHFCYSPLMFDEVELAFNYKIKDSEQKLYAIDCSAVNDAKVKLQSGKRYQLSDGDVIEAVSLSHGKEVKFQKLIVSIFHSSYPNKEVVNFREFEKEGMKDDKYNEAYGLSDFDHPDDQDAKFETIQDHEFGSDDFEQLSDQHFEICILGNGEGDEEEVKENECVVLIPSKDPEKVTYFYMKKKVQMERAEASTECSSIKNFEITLQNRFRRDWQTSFKIQ